MKICFAINNLQAGGAERVFSSIVNWFVDNTGYTIYALLFSYSFEMPDFYLLDKRVKVFYSKFNDYKDAVKLFRQICPDCVVSFLNPMNYVISMATKELGITHIACERNDPYFSPKYEDDRKKRDFAFYNATGCIFQTAHAASYYDKALLKGQMKIIQNPVCIKRKDKESVKENRIVSIGRYADQKNYPILLQAFSLFRSKHPQYRLDCYGKNSGRLQTIKALAFQNQWDRGVTFSEPIASIHSEISSAKLFLMTSSYEGMPNSLIEACALGIPCVAVDVPGIRDVVERFQCGVLCPEHKPEMLASAMENILNDSIIYSIFSENGKRIADDMGIDTIAPLWKNFIDTVLNTFNPHVI